MESFAFSMAALLAIASDEWEGREVPDIEGVSVSTIESVSADEGESVSAIEEVSVEEARPVIEVVMSGLAKEMGWLSKFIGSKDSLSDPKNESVSKDLCRKVTQ
jgi:hypothetical protein